MKKRYFVCLVLFCSLSLAAYAGSGELRILHINDFHGFADGYAAPGAKTSLGGIAYLAGTMDHLKKQKPSLFLSAGDMVQGDNWANLFKGESVIQLMNLMKLDASALGNHEFDFGQVILRQRIAEANFPFLAANVIGVAGVKSSIIKQVGGVKIGIIGISTLDTPISTSPKNVIGLAFLSPEAVVQRYVDQLRSKVDVIVVLSHSGFSVEKALAEKVKGIDVIVGGHSHTKVEKPAVVGKTVIVQAWEHAKALGVLDLTVKDGKVVKAEGRLVEIRPSLDGDNREVAVLVAKFRDKVNKVLSQVIAKTTVDLDGLRAHIRAGETNLGDLVADIIRRTAGADIAMINSGIIRTSIRQGDIKIGDIYAVLPFDNYVVKVQLTGKQLREALEHGVSGIADESGAFPQVSGLSFTFKADEPKGKKIGKVTVGGRPLIESKIYIVATTDFMAVGGDGYEAFKAAGKKAKSAGTSKMLRDVVVDYVKSIGVVSPKIDGRIKPLK